MGRKTNTSGRAYFEARTKTALPVSKPDSDAVYTKIITEFKDRQRAEIQKWRQALNAATDPQNQKLFVLQDLYDSLRSDGHLISQVNLRKAATLCSGFSIIDKRTGKEQPDKSVFFRSQWYYDFMEDALDSIMRGYTLLELTNPVKPEFTALPRRNIIPLKGQVIFSVNDDKGLLYMDRLGDTIIEIGNTDELGLMADLCGQLIWKRNAQQSWAEYSERFGMPLITATTNTSSDADIARTRGMLSTLGEAAQAVLPAGTTIDVKETKAGDNYLVYDKQIERINSEMGKPITGGTMISDNGASRSQGEVHERNLDDKIAARDKRIIMFITNDQLIPMLAHKGHDLNPDTDVLIFDQSYKLTLKEHWEIVNGAHAWCNIPAEWISKTFGFPIDSLKEPATASNPATSRKTPEQIFTPGTFTANFR